MASTTNQMVNSGKSTFDKAKDVMNDAGFNDADQAIDTVKSSLRTAQETAMDLADKTVKVAKKNPLYFAAGAAGLGLLIGGLLMRNKRKH
jgi:ElaB/YqjD/DUF883 family membrane-anchored ribosome-binding protein